MNSKTIALTVQQFEDLDVIVEELIGAFNEAVELKRGTMTLQSKVGSRFNERVERLASALFEIENATKLEAVRHGI